MCRDRKETPTKYPDWIPKPLPGNEDIFEAFKIVRSIRQPSLTGAPPFDWTAVESRLRLHGLWRLDIVEGLSDCEIIMRGIEIKVQEEERMRRAARAKSQKKAPRR